MISYQELDFRNGSDIYMEIYESQSDYENGNLFSYQPISPITISPGNNQNPGFGMSDFEFTWNQN